MPSGGVDALYIAKPVASRSRPGLYAYYYNLVGCPGVSDGWYSLKVEVDTDGGLTAVNGDAVHLSQGGPSTLEQGDERLT